MSEEQSLLPSLSSWAYKRIPDPELVVYSPAIDYIQGDGGPNYAERLHAPVYSGNFYAVNTRSEDAIRYDEYVENTGCKEIICLPTRCAEGSAYGFSQYTDHTHAECILDPKYNDDNSWDAEYHHLPMEDALFDNSYWQSSIVTNEDDLHSPSEDYDRAKKLTGQQRIAANRRERRRMNTINQAFEALRMHLPILECERKLSKADTLRVAADYIKFMSHILATTAPKPPEHGGRGDMLRIISKTKSVKNEDGVQDPDSDAETGSVLLTWSRIRKQDNSINRNGKRKIRAPIWKPEFPSRDHEYRDILQSQSYSLGQRFVADTCEEPPNKMLRLQNIAVVDDRYALHTDHVEDKFNFIPSQIPISQNENHRSNVLLEQLRSPCQADYQQCLPGSSHLDDSSYFCYSTSSIQPTNLCSQDVYWPITSCHTQYGGADLIPNIISTQTNILPPENQECFTSGTITADVLPQFVYHGSQPLCHPTQTTNVHEMNITAL